MCAVVGVTPSSTTRSPSSALMSALFPALNSPTTTSRNKSSSCRIELARVRRILLRGRQPGEAVPQFGQQCTPFREGMLGRDAERPRPRDRHRMIVPVRPHPICMSAMLRSTTARARALLIDAMARLLPLSHPCRRNDLAEGQHLPS